MGPLTNLLVYHMPQMHASLNVAHIPHGDMAHPFCLAEGDDLASRLVKNLSLLPIQFRAASRLAFREALGSPRAKLTATQALLHGGMTFVAALLAGAQHSP
jgi:hypothetical protein